jgi:L-lactate dehydrogenase complex protein LldG
MTIENREIFLNHLSDRLDQPRHQLAQHPYQPFNNLPTTTLADKTPAELLALAQKNSEAIPVTFVTTEKADLGKVLSRLITERHGGPILLPTTSAFETFGLTDWQQQLAQKEKVDYWQAENGRAANLKLAEDANLSISFADFLLAESGTITVSSSAGQGRAFHFLPQHYVSVIPQSKIVPRSTQAVAWYDQEIQAGRLSSSAIHFITGPSNSGDIEMHLVTGVHGPLDVSYVVVTDC